MRAQFSKQWLLVLILFFLFQITACGPPWSVCEISLVPYVDAVSVMRVLLFVLHVYMLRECKGAWDKRSWWSV